MGNPCDGTPRLRRHLSKYALFPLHQSNGCRRCRGRLLQWICCGRGGWHDLRSLRHRHRRLGSHTSSNLRFDRTQNHARRHQQSRLRAFGAFARQCGHIESFSTRRSRNMGGFVPPHATSDFTAVNQLPTLVTQKRRHPLGGPSHSHLDRTAGCPCK